MEQISFKVENFVVTISGIGAKDKGSITITDSTQRTRSLELTELCLERGKATGQEKASARVEESAHHIIATATGDILVDKESLNRALEVAESDFNRISGLFATAIDSGVPHKSAAVAFEERLAMVRDRWIATGHFDVTQGTQPAQTPWVKERNFLPLYIGRNPNSGEVEVLASTKQFVDSGESKLIKRVVGLTGSRLHELVKLSPQKTKQGPTGREIASSPGEIAVTRAEIDAEIEKIQEMEREGIPHLPHSYTISYEAKDRSVKKRSFQERCGESLFTKVNHMQDKIEAEQPYEEEFVDILSHLLDAFDCVRHMHATGRVHGDLKPENVLSKGKETRVVDFGYMRKEGEKDKLRGSPGSIAPELIYDFYFGDDAASIDPGMMEWRSSSDAWSLGIMLLSVVNPSPRIQQLEFNILTQVKDKKTAKTKIDELIRNIEMIRRHLMIEGDELSLLISDLLNTDVNARPTVEVAFQHLSGYLRELKLRLGLE